MTRYFRDINNPSTKYFFIAITLLERRLPISRTVNPEVLEIYTDHLLENFFSNHARCR